MYWHHPAPDRCLLFGSGVAPAIAAHVAPKGAGPSKKGACTRCGAWRARIRTSSINKAVPAANLKRPVARTKTCGRDASMGASKRRHPSVRASSASLAQTGTKARCAPTGPRAMHSAALHDGVRAATLAVAHSGMARSALPSAPARSARARSVTCTPSPASSSSRIGERARKVAMLCCSVRQRRCLPQKARPSYNSVALAASSAQCASRLSS